jgi:hypothetical protein
MSDKPETQSSLMKQIEQEITDYTSKNVTIGEVPFSQYKLVRRIALFESKSYPNGKFDSGKNYKYFFDINQQRIDSEVKNVDFDTKNIEAYTSRKSDVVKNIIINLALIEWLRKNGQAEELNSSIEEGAGWGNIVWKKVRGSYERCDLRNFYVINQAAVSLKDTPVIERHALSQSQLRAASKKWNQEYFKQVIKSCGENQYKKDDSSSTEETTVPYYTIYERNGEINVADLKTYKGEQVLDGDKDKYVLAKVIAAGVGSNGGVKIKYILFADEISEMPYKEYHRGRYKGRWFREGIYELLFDIQVRANEIGNQIARGLEWASKQVFYSPDKLLVQNILTDLKNGDIIKTTSLNHVPVRMEGFDQLVADWNRLMQLANELCNSSEIVQGGDLPAGTPFRLGSLLNTNANKLFVFIRQKLAIPFQEIFEEWIIPQLIKELTQKEVLRLTGDSDMLKRLYEIVVDNWYLRNLVAIGVHTNEVGVMLKQAKMAELMKSDTLFIKEFKDMFKEYQPNVAVIITGENVDIQEKLQTYATFIQLESDPVRRSYLIEKAMQLKGIDSGSLPRSTPEQLQTSAVPTEAPASEEVENAKV